MRRPFLRKFAWLAAAGLIGPRAGATPLRDLLAARGADRPGADDEGMSGLTAHGPFELPSGAQVERDIPWGPDPIQRLDVYRPAHADGAPVIFMVHGGAWDKGDKGLWRTVKNKVAHWVGKGYVLVSPNYRMLPVADPVEQANDVAKSLAFAQSKLRSWGGDPSRIVVMGHSAGAHLVSLLTADPTIAARHGAKPWLGTVSLDSGAMNVVELMEARHFALYDRVFKSDPAYWREASPTLRLKTAPVAPMLVVCSTGRRDSCPQAKAFAEKANSLGGRVNVLPVDLGHAEINDRLGTHGEYTEGVDSFLRSLGLR